MPEDTIASAAWRTWASVIPHPKLFQLFQPSGGVSAGLPGAASAVVPAEAVTQAVSVSAVAVRRRSSRLGMGPRGGASWETRRKPLVTVPDRHGHKLLVVCPRVSAAG
ncbi:hypothetical protein STSP_63100 [Streptomyces jeddahensis]|uniref:Uncharacterized protein n=1 Tax=Streptomyces jeddahensis TaxID=1716141 RepID=A0A177HIC7_9ACTN|nr:hypothetical protein STSP_63100 [Streptomyces jeddahensis]